MSSLLLLVLVVTTMSYLLPDPPGKYNVSLRTGSLIDYTRTDPQAGTPRELMVSVFQPATCAHPEYVHYMPNKTAEYQGPFLQDGPLMAPTDLTPLFLDARLPVCPIEATCRGVRPVLLFSPAYSIPRFYYNVLASAIASHDFTVITIDHPEDANIITYPDGHVVYNNGSDNPSDAEYLDFQDRRVVDISFVVDQLSNATAMAQQLNLQAFPTDRVAVLGHSLGGSSALRAASQDSRLRGASNWDGTIFGSPETSKPVLLVSEAGIENVSPTWNATWPHLTGPKLWIMVANTSHYTFSDVPTLLQAAGEDAAPYEGLLDTIAPAELVRIMASYTAAWMRGVFRGMEGGPLLRGEEAGRFPEVSTVLKGGF